MTISPLEFFSHLRWIDERPLLDVIEPYRQRIFTETLYTFGEDGTPHYNPTRPDALTWITSYASIYNSPGNPLFDLMAQGKRGEDPRMFFSWYSSEFCTDPDYADAEPEARANPSMPSGNPTYLAQQRRRLPSHKVPAPAPKPPRYARWRVSRCGARHGRGGRRLVKMDTKTRRELLTPRSMVGIGGISFLAGLSAF